MKVSELIEFLTKGEDGWKPRPNHRVQINTSGQSYTIGALYTTRGVTHIDIDPLEEGTS